MKESLLNTLICPDCKAGFRLKDVKEAREEIISGNLECASCGIRYPIVGGIPRILPEHERLDNYSRNFQYYWLNMDWHRPRSNKERFYQLTDWRPQDIRDKFVLEAGCGGGRWLYQFAEEGAREIIAFDYTLAIERAKAICSSFNNIHYVQADIFKLPFRDNHFDLVHCHGVLMATPDPRSGIENLAKKVRPGGELAVLLYRNLTRFQKLIDDSICGITKRLPTELMFYLTWIPTLMEYVPGAVPLLENIVHLSGQPDFTLKHLHNFDWYTCKYRHRNSPKQVTDWLEDFGFHAIKIPHTNDFRTRSRFHSMRNLKESLLERGYFLKATLGIKATKKHSRRSCVNV
jgi:SAM-dependent methyltransferase